MLWKAAVLSHKSPYPHFIVWGLLYVNCNSKIYLVLSRTLRCLLLVWVKTQSVTEVNLSNLTDWPRYLAQMSMVLMVKYIWWNHICTMEDHLQCLWTLAIPVLGELGYSSFCSFYPSRQSERSVEEAKANHCRWFLRQCGELPRLSAQSTHSQQ